MAFKTFVDGAVLTASDVNTYLMKQTVIVCTSGTRPSSPVSGMTIYETDTNQLAIYTGAAWEVRNRRRLYIRKTSDESLTSNATLQDDDALTFTVETNSEYELSGMVIYSAGTTEKMKCGFVGPAGATLDWHHLSADSTVTAQSGDAWWGTSTISSVNTLGGSGTANAQSMRPAGILKTVGTSGTFKFQWAQNTSGVNATTVKAGSYLILDKIA